MTELSIGENKTTKLDRIGKLAETNKGTVFNNLKHVITLEFLRECYQTLDGKKAIGSDGVTKEEYGMRLEENLQDLLARICRNGYKPKPSKIVEIPKEDGSTRPLAISCFEDKIVQVAVTRILTVIYEPLFLPCSYGYRAGISCHDALRSLMKYSNEVRNGATIEIDLRKYFNTIPHKALLDILQEKISDKRFLKLVIRLIRAPILLENGSAQLNKIGCPQGSILSPILANLYLHHVVDNWFYEIRKTHLKGKAELVRYADDMVFVFQRHEEAERFYRILPKRLEKYGLELHVDKSAIIVSGRKAAELAKKRGERLSTYKFLGFTCYWGLSRKGFMRLKFKSRSDRVAAKLKGLRKYLKANRNAKTQVVIRQVILVVKGWANYYAISDNERNVSAFIRATARELFRWMNRRGGRRKMNWTRFTNILKIIRYPRHFKTTSMFTTY